MKKDIYCIVVLEASSLELRCPQGPGEGALQPASAGPCPPGLQLLTRDSASCASASRAPLSERQLSALGPPSSGLTSAPETLFSNKVRFRRAGAVSSQDTVSRASSPNALPVCQHQSRGLPPSFSVVLARALPVPPEPGNDHFRGPSLSCLAQGISVKPPLPEHLQTPHSNRSPVCPSPWLPHAQ